MAKNKIQELIEKFEKRVKTIQTNQKTTFDDIDPKKFEGLIQAYEEVIEELKNSLKTTKS